MRSSVGIMLSQTGETSFMSHPDYEQNVFHHSCLLVLLRGIGPSKPKTLQKVFERVKKINNVKITDSFGNQRDIWIRYVHEYPVENSLWGDFQTHRRLLGLITIGKFETQIELNELCRLHESLKVKYNETLYDSRAILFGPSTEKADSNIRKDDVDKMTIQSKNILNETLNHPLKNLVDEYTTPSNFKSTCFFYRENDAYSDLDKHMTDFVSSLFWILESKRLKRASEKVDKAPLLYAPFEKKDFVGLDMESKTSRKRCIGRITKNLADLTLQSGLITEALNLYHASSETLRAINDSLWLGASEEGLCATSSILLYPRMQHVDVFYRNCSLQEGTSPYKYNPYGGRRCSSDFSSKNRLENKEINHEKTAASNSSSSSSVSSILTSSSGTSSGSTPVNTGSSTTKSGHSTNTLPANILSEEEIISHFRKAIINYSKYRHAGIIETEAALKAARVCIYQNRNLDVAMFLQNVLYINVCMTETDRVKRFEVLTDLYQQIGYKRKAAFCQRLAAWKHVAQGNPNPDWSQSYRLMLECFPGYMLSLDPIEFINNSCGWPMLQIDLLQQLIMAAKRLGHSSLATRHMTYLLQTQWENMSPNERKEMALQLQNLSAQCEGSPVALVLENGIVIPPANLTDIPYCLQMQINNLPAHLRACEIIISKVENGPFLFTPIHFNSIERKTHKRAENKIQFYWIQNDLSEVTVTLKNTLPFELVVNDMRLLTSGIVFEALPQTITLQPDIITHIQLNGIPIESGQLEIQGYSTHTLGVKSNCRLKHMKKRNFPSNFLVEVIPSLPKLSAKTSLSKTTSLSTVSNSNSVIETASVSLYNGQKIKSLITLKNESSIPIEHLEVSMFANIESNLLNKIFIVSQNEIQSKLPINPDQMLEFTLEICGEADFLNPIPCRRPNSTNITGNINLSGTTGVNSDLIDNFNYGLSNNNNSLNYSVMSSGHTSLPSRVSSPSYQMIGKRNEITSSFRSSNSSNNPGKSGQHSPITLANLNDRSNMNFTFEAELRLRYSGGEGMKKGFCRECAISFNVDLMPSVQITGWDVLPAETISQFYLVLDVSNLTNQEMTFNYTNCKNIIIEARDSCRVPIPVDRCSLSKIKYNIDQLKSHNEALESGAIIIIPTQEEIHESICSKHIAEQVNLSWYFTGTETTGIASLQGIRLSSQMIDLITVAPLQWGIIINDTIIQPQSEFICTAGERVSLKIQVTNQSSNPLKHLALTIQFYQDYLNGVHNYHLETRLMITGPNQIVIPNLDINENYNHECSVLFFTPGRYKANFQCRSIDIQSQTDPSEGGLFRKINSSDVNNTDKDSSDIYLTDYAYALNNFNVNNINFDKSQHTWKFMPPVEITVVESS